MRDDLFSNLSVFLRGFPEQNQNEPKQIMLFFEKNVFFEYLRVVDAIKITNF